MKKAVTVKDSVPVNVIVSVRDTDLDGVGVEEDVPDPWGEKLFDCERVRVPLPFVNDAVMLSEKVAVDDRFTFDKEPVRVCSSVIVMDGVPGDFERVFSFVAEKVTENVCVLERLAATVDDFEKDSCGDKDSEVENVSVLVVVLVPVLDLKDETLSVPESVNDTVDDCVTVPSDCVTFNVALLEGVIVSRVIVSCAVKVPLEVRVTLSVSVKLLLKVLVGLYERVMDPLDAVKVSDQSRVDDSVNETCCVEVSDFVSVVVRVGTVPDTCCVEVCEKDDNDADDVTVCEKVTVNSGDWLWVIDGEMSETVTSCVKDVDSLLVSVKLMEESKLTVIDVLSEELTVVVRDGVADFVQLTC